MKYYLSIVKHKTEFFLHLQNQKSENWTKFRFREFHWSKSVCIFKYPFKTLLDYYLHSSLIIETWAFRQTCISGLPDSNLQYHEGKVKWDYLSERLLDTFLLVIPHSSKTSGKKGKKLSSLNMSICRTLVNIHGRSSIPPWRALTTTERLSLELQQRPLSWH